MQNDFFHTNLRNARKRAGYSQEGLANELDLCRSTISSLETGKTNLFSKHIPVIARCFGISETELLCGDAAETLLKQQPLWAERVRTLKEDFEKEKSALRAELERTRKELAEKETSLKRMEEINHFLMKQMP